MEENKKTIIWGYCPEKCEDVNLQKKDVADCEIFPYEELKKIFNDFKDKNIITCNFCITCQKVFIGK